MIRKKEWMFVLILFTCGLCLLSSCKNGVELKKINGVLEEPVTIQLPEHLKKAYEAAVKVHPFELMNDSANNVCVLGIGELDNGLSTEGYGVMVVMRLRLLSTKFAILVSQKLFTMLLQTVYGSLRV